MDSSSEPKPSPRREVQLQGPRPTPLNVSKGSHKIRKPPVAPAQQQQRQPPLQQHQPRAPVIIYTVSPKVIHTDPGDFMTLVQRLTGASPTSLYPPAAPGALSPGPSGPLSPAARLAAIERGCTPLDAHKSVSAAAAANANADGVVEQLGMGISAALDVGYLPGILSPLPSALPTISPSFFSPPPSAGDLGSLAFPNELSPVFRGGRGFMDSPFLPSPGNLLFTPTVPSPGAYWDLFGQL